MSKIPPDLIEWSENYLDFISQLHLKQTARDRMMCQNILQLGRSCPRPSLRRVRKISDSIAALRISKASDVAKLTSFF